MKDIHIPQHSIHFNDEVNEFKKKNNENKLMIRQLHLLLQYKCYIHISLVLLKKKKLMMNYFN